eukprot:scaffold4409_cov369-Prasinococcus_capsulatus_cf.AAC.30
MASMLSHRRAAHLPSRRAAGQALVPATCGGARALHAADAHAARPPAAALVRASGCYVATFDTEGPMCSRHLDMCQPPYIVLPPAPRETCSTVPPPHGSPLRVQLDSPASNASGHMRARVRAAASKMCASGDGGRPPRAAVRARAGRARRT